MKSMKKAFFAGVVLFTGIAGAHTITLGGEEYDYEQLATVSGSWHCLPQETKQEYKAVIEPVLAEAKQRLSQTQSRLDKVKIVDEEIAPLSGALDALKAGEVYEADDAGQWVEVTE